MAKRVSPALLDGFNGADVGNDAGEHGSGVYRTRTYVASQSVPSFSFSAICRNFAEARMVSSGNPASAASPLFSKL
jgi:hypothetical protein